MKVYQSELQTVLQQQYDEMIRSNNANFNNPINITEPIRHLCRRRTLIPSISDLRYGSFQIRPCRMPRQDIDNATTIGMC